MIRRSWRSKCGRSRSESARLRKPPPREGGGWGRESCATTRNADTFSDARAFRPARTRTPSTHLPIPPRRRPKTLVLHAVNAFSLSRPRSVASGRSTGVRVMGYHFALNVRQCSRTIALPRGSRSAARLRRNSFAPTRLHLSVASRGRSSRRRLGQSDRRRTVRGRRSHRGGEWCGERLAAGRRVRCRVADLRRHRALSVPRHQRQRRSDHRARLAPGLPQRPQLRLVHRQDDLSDYIAEFFSGRC